LLIPSFLPFVFGPFLGQGFVARLAFEQAKPALDHGRRHRLTQDALVGGGDDGAGAVLDAEELAEPQRDHHLAFRGEPDGIVLRCRIHEMMHDSC